MSDERWEPYQEPGRVAGEVADPAAAAPARSLKHPWRYVAAGAGIVVLMFGGILLAGGGGGSGLHGNDHYDPLDPGSFEAMVAAVKARTGSTEVLSVTLIPEHHYDDVLVRAPSGGGDADDYYFDGTLTSADSGQQWPGPSFDLAKIDPSRLGDVCAASHEDPASCEVVIEPPHRDGAVFGTDRGSFDADGHRVGGPFG